MQNLQNTLVELLRDDSNYTSEGKLLKNKLTEDALELETSLLKYLLKNDRLKKHFFIIFLVWIDLYKNIKNLKKIF